MTDKNGPEPLDPDSADDVTGFDLDAWIDDAKPPQRSMTVYRRADLQSRIDELDRQIRLAEGQEGSAAEAGVQGLKAEWDKVARQIADSAVTVTVRAVTDDAAKQARADAKAEGIKGKAAAEWDEEGYADDAREAAEDEAEIEGLDDEEREALLRRRTVEARRDYINARWVQAVGEHLLVRLLVSPKMTIEQVRSLSEQIGSTQRDKLMALPGQAAQDLRPVSANFSPSPSSRRGQGTSSKRSGQRGAGQSRR
jgi:hypothetical protein